MSTNRPPRMLVIAPHPDDEVLGAGGTIARFATAGVVTVATIAAHMPPLYTEEHHEQTVAEAKKAHQRLGVEKSIFLNNPAVLLQRIELPEFNRMVSTIVAEAEPDVLLIPYYDRHVDHRHVFDACMVAARPYGVGRNIGLVAAYESLSETHWNAPHLEPNFTPNWNVDISDHIDAKLDAMRCYESQLHPFPRAALGRGAQGARALPRQPGGHGLCRGLSFAAPVTRPRVAVRGVWINWTPFPLIGEHGAPLP